MKTALVVGAGKSSLFLIEYLLRGAADGGYRVVVADADRSAAEAKIAGHPTGAVVTLDATDAAARMALVESADVVCSLLPPSLHTLLAHDCLAAGRPLITASYVSDEMRALDAEARAKGLLFMCEMGLDPGIDHMSAMEIFERIHSQGGEVQTFISSCGGLVAPESDDNPWHYKFSWNPMNVVNAGRDGARYRMGGEEHELPYGLVFLPTTPALVIPPGGIFGAYPNRDSVPYAALYGVPHIPTIVRMTLRRPEFLWGWCTLVMLGLTRDGGEDVIITTGLTPYAWMAQATRCPPGTDLRIHLAELISNGQATTEHRETIFLSVESQFDSIGLFSTELLESFGVPFRATPAQILYHLLLRAWAMRPEDKDMVVMQHIFGWTDAAGVERRTASSIILEGESAERTAMAKTVGLPMGILARMLLREEPGLPVGVCIPTMPEVYEPVLRALEAEGIVFNEVEE